MIPTTFKDVLRIVEHNPTHKDGTVCVIRFRPRTEPEEKARVILAKRRQLIYDRNIDVIAEEIEPDLFVLKDSMMVLP